jgi:hypothetical protein
MRESHRGSGWTATTASSRPLSAPATRPRCVTAMSRPDWQQRSVATVCRAAHRGTASPP